MRPSILGINPMAKRAPIVPIHNAQPVRTAEAVPLSAEKGSPFASLPGILSSMMAAGATVDLLTPPLLNRALAAISFPRLQE